MPRDSEKPLDEIVREVGKFALDAFVFVQDCIGEATQRIHGPMSAEATAVVNWMAQEHVTNEELVSRYEIEDMPFEIVTAIRELGGPESLNRHVTGQQLCQVLRDVALERWGLMARSVLTRWNVSRTEDFGEIVFALVNNGWLQKQPTDSIDDFENVFSFDKAFDREYRLVQ